MLWVCEEILKRLNFHCIHIFFRAVFLIEFQLNIYIYAYIFPVPIQSNLFCLITYIFRFNEFFFSSTTIGTVLRKWKVHAELCMSIKGAF